MLCSLSEMCVFSLRCSALVESLCVNKRFVAPDSFWMQTRSPNHLNSAVSGVFLVSQGWFLPQREL